MKSLLACAALFVISPIFGQIDQGPGGPILVLAGSSNPFGKYYAEILRTEGFNEFAVADVASVTASQLASFDVVVLGETPLSSTQVQLLTNYVNNGGNLIAMRPDFQLSGLLGISSQSSTLTSAYLLVNTSAPPGAGIVGETMRFYGPANLYSLSGATAVATLYSTASSATFNPAVTLRSSGSGQAAAFTYDLARSVVYNRQGNPAWINQARYHSGPLAYPADLFYPDWLDRSKMHIPHADEQMRLLANLILHMNRNKKPLPRFWYLPFSRKAALVMTDDEHATGGSVSHFNMLNSFSPANCVVANWECARATSFTFYNNPAGNSTLAAYTAQGFELTLHAIFPGQIDPSVADSVYSQQVNQFVAALPGVGRPVTERSDIGPPWFDWIGMPVSQIKFGIRMDFNYLPAPLNYYIADPGFLNGSAMLMRFADTNGAMIDNYQAAASIFDQAGTVGNAFWNPVFDKMVGPQEFYGFITSMIHADYDWQDQQMSIPLTQAALAHGMAIVSGRQALAWLDGKNSSSFSGFSWNGAQLSFSVTAGASTAGLRGMLPSSFSGTPLTSLSRNGSNVSFTTQTIKGVSYAFFDASIGGTFQAQYGTNPTPPPAVISNSPAGTGVSTGTVVSASFSRAMNPSTFTSSTFTLRANGSSSNVPATVTASGSTATLSPASALAFGTTYSATVAASVTDTNGIALGTPYTWTFTTAASGGGTGSTATTLGSSLNPSLSGQSVTFTATVTSSSGTPSGPIVFTVDGVAGSPISTNPAAFTTSSLAVGSHTVTATFSGNAGWSNSSNTMTQVVQAPVALPPPLGLWTFNEGAGVTAADISGNGNSATLANGAAWTTGAFGNALQMNGGIANLGNPPLLNNLSKFTYSLWANATGANTFQGPAIEKGSGGDTRKTFTFGATTGNSPFSVYGSVRAASQTAYSDAVAGTYTLNVWTHWAMTYDDQGDRKIHIYKNGVEVAYAEQVAAAGALSTDAETLFAFGATPNGRNYTFNGALDEIRIYDRALSSAEVLTLATARPDLTIGKTHVGNFTQGQNSATYAVTVSNQGAAATSGTVTVTEALPAGLSLVSMSGSGWTCSSATCTRSDALTGGASYPVITVTVNVAANAANSVINTVTVAGGGESNTGNNSATDTTIVNTAGLPDLTIGKTHAGNFTAGQNGATYTVTVNNTGAAATSGTVTVTESLPAGLSLVSMSGTGWTCSASTCTRSSVLSAGTSYPAIIVTVNVAANASGSLTNTVTVSGGGENNTGNNVATDPTTITAGGGISDLTIGKTHAGNFIQGQNGAIYTVTVSNVGSTSTSGTVTVTESLPAGLTLVSMSGTGWTCSSNTCNRSNALTGGASYPAVTVTVNVAANAGGSLTNSVTVSGGGDGNTSNNVATDATTIDAVVNPAAWYDAAWGYRKRITFKKETVSGSAALTSFPVVVKTTDAALKTTSNGGHMGKANGGDIVFTASDGVTKLDHEIESYAPSTGELVSWVRIPSLSPAADTTVFAYYGNAGAADQWNTSGVWDSSYKIVNHLKDDSATVADSTSNHNNAIRSSGGASIISGLLGSAYSFNGTSGSLRIANSPTWSGSFASYTVQFWIKFGDVISYHGATGIDGWGGPLSIWFNRTNEGPPVMTTGLRVGGTDCVTEVDTGIDTTNTQNYYHLALVYNAGTARVYVNGIERGVTSNCSGTTSLGNLPLEIGGLGDPSYNLQATIDEYRISTANRSADWVMSEVQNQSDPVNTAVGSEQAR